MSWMRGQTSVIYVLAGMILFGLTLLSLIGYVSGLTGNLSDGSIEKLCRTSIETRMMTGVQSSGDSTFSLTGLSCKKQDLKITPNALYQDRWFSNIIYDDDERVANAKLSVMKKVADQLVNCKYMFLENRHEDLFATAGSEMWETFGIDEDKPKCFTCYSIAVKEFDGFITSKEFSEYLIRTEYIDGLTYNDYLQGGGDLGGQGATMIATNIVPDGLYGIGYFGRNSDSGVPVDMEEVYEKALLGGAVGGAVGGVAGTLGVAACIVGAPICITLGAAITVFAGATVAASAAGATLSYQNQLKAEYLYGDTGLLKSRDYGYFVLDDLEVLETHGCKTQ